MKYEFINYTDKTLSVNIANSAINSLRSTEHTETTCRVYDKGYIGAFGAVGACDKAEMLKKATEMLQFKIEYPDDLPADSKKSVNDCKTPIARCEFVSRAKSVVERLKREFPNYIFSNKINLSSVDATYENSEGVSYDYKGDSLMISITIKHVNSSNIMDFYIEGYKNTFDEEQFFADAKKLISAYEKTVEFPSEKLPVIVNNGVLNYLGSHLLGATYASGASLLSKKLNEKVFSDKFNLSFERNAEVSPATPFFDGEGIALDKFKIVDKGVLSGLVATRRTAKTYSLPVSGSASAPVGSAPLEGFNSLHIEATASSLSEIVSGKAIYVFVTSGGDMTPSGDVALPVMVGFLYENGELLGRLPEFTVSANIFDMLGKGYLGAVDNAIFGYTNEPLIVCEMDVRES